MKQTELPENPLDREIIALLALSTIPPLEKQIWLSILSEMTEGEKVLLKDDLDKAMKFRQKETESAAKTFISHLVESK